MRTGPDTLNAPTVPDAPPDNWVHRYAPSWFRPYARLARFDRPIGAWLLLFPCWWSLALAEHANGATYPSIRFVVLFWIGALTDVVSEGDDVVVKVINIDEQGRIRLSRKQAFGVDPDEVLNLRG